jgi:hypothetical protein
MGFNPVHYRKTWQSIGMPFDPPAVTDLNAPWSAISLLKSVLGATMGIIPPGAVGTELAEHSVTFPQDPAGGRVQPGRPRPAVQRRGP